MDGTPVPIRNNDEGIMDDVEEEGQIDEAIDEAAEEIVNKVEDNDPPDVNNEYADALEHLDDVPLQDQIDNLEEQIANEYAEEHGEAGVPVAGAFELNDIGDDNVAPTVGNEQSNGGG